LEYVSKALEARPEGVDPILIGDLNANLADPESARAGEIADTLAAHGLEDMFGHFRPRRPYRDGHTWSMLRQGRLITSRCDYLLGVDRRTFTNVCLKAPRYDSDHYMVLGTIRSAKLKENRVYLRGRRKFPLETPTVRPMTQADCLFEDLRSSVERPENQVSRRASWISDESWKLIDTRLALRREAGHDQAAIRRLTRRIQASLKADRKSRVEKAGANVEALLQKEPSDLQGAWNALKGWYRVAGDRAPPPSRDTLEKVTAEREDLYRKETPPQGSQSRSWSSRWPSRTKFQKWKRLQKQ
jgi:hypothetical protein